MTRPKPYRPRAAAGKSRRNEVHPRAGDFRETAEDLLRYWLASTRGQRQWGAWDDAFTHRLIGVLKNAEANKPTWRATPPTLKRGEQALGWSGFALIGWSKDETQYVAKGTLWWSEPIRPPRRGRE